MSYRELSQRSVSEKISLAWLEPSQRLSAAWDRHGDEYGQDIYVADVKYWVIAVTVNSIKLSQASGIDALVEGSFYFDPENKKLYAWLQDDGDPKFEWTQVTYRMFFSDAPISLPFDLDAGIEVPYEPMISKVSQGGARFDPEESSIVIEASGSIGLFNSDGFFQPIFDRLTWQSQKISLFSLVRDIDNQHIIRIFEGQITAKQYAAEAVSFSANDFVYKLKGQLDLPLYSDDDGRIPESLVGKPKRRIYGRARGLKSESLDRRLTKYPAKVIASDVRTDTNITASTSTGSNIVTASSGDIIDELCTGDRVEIGDNQYTVVTVGRIQVGLEQERDVTISKPVGSTVRFVWSGIDTSGVTTSDFLAIGSLPNFTSTTSDQLRGIHAITAVNAGYLEISTTLTTGATAKVDSGGILVIRGGSTDKLYISETSPASQTGLQIDVIPKEPYRRLNRKHLIAGHACHEVNIEVEIVRSSTRFVVSDVSNLRIGDLVTFDGTKLNTIVAILADTRDIRVQDGVNPLPQHGEGIKRLAVQRVAFQASDFVPLRDYTVTNDPSGASLTFDNQAELNVTPRNSLGQVIWANGVRSVVSIGASFTGLKSRDWIRVANESDWYEIDEVIRDQVLVLKRPYTGSSGTKISVSKTPTYIDDKSNIFIDTYGITDDGLPTGNLVQTAADATLHTLREAGITNIDELSFAEGSIDAPYLLSVVVPRQSNLAPLSYRGLLNRFNSSSMSTVFVGSDYNLKYSTVSAKRLESQATQVTDFDVVSDSITSDSSSIIGRIVANYRFQDLDEVSEEATNQTLSIDSEFVGNSGIESQIKDVELFLFDTDDASEIASRLMFMTELPRSEVTLEGKIDLNNLFLNDLVVYRAERLFDRYGSADNARVGVVVNTRKGPQFTTATISDLGNIFSRVAVTSPADSSDYDPDTVENFTSYITDDAGTLDDDQSLGSNLIS